MHVFAMETFGKFLFSSLAYSKNLSCEMEGLACYLVVEVHLYAVFADLEHDSRNHSAHAVEHWDGITWYEKVLAYFTVHFECRFRQVENA